jgi:SAM-dependent methyltransferase
MAQGALDVGCGTGLSSVALLDLADMVVGCDVDRHMLAAAPRHGGVFYVQARAETLPFDKASFDAVTVASSVHWFEQKLFWAEAQRVLHPGGWLALYDHGFVGKMDGSDAFSTWTTEVYLRRYPTPPRNREVEVSVPLLKVEEESYEEWIPPTRTQLVDYLMTQSNTLVATLAGVEDARTTRAWLSREASKFVGRGQATNFLFWGRIACFQSPASA